MSSADLAERPAEVTPPVARRARPPRRHAPHGSSGWIASTALLWLAAVLVGYGVYVVLISGLRYSSAQSAGYDRLRSDLANGVAPVSQTDGNGVLVAVGTPVALLQIPRLGLDDVVVVEGTSAQALQSGPGHQRDTVFPGQVGISILQGRAAAFGGPFGGIDRLRAGDRIVVTTGQGTSTFRVMDQRREGDPTPSYVVGSARLTLVSAGGVPFVPRGVVRVDAALVGTAHDASQVVARDLPADEKPLGTAPDTLPVTILWLQLLVAVALAASWAWLRWGRRRTWIVFGPLSALMLIVVGSRITLLLPNLL